MAPVRPELQIPKISEVSNLHSNRHAVLKCAV